LIKKNKKKLERNKSYGKIELWTLELRSCKPEPVTDGRKHCTPSSLSFRKNILVSSHIHFFQRKVKQCHLISHKKERRIQW
jgi:hypothetical protein